MAKPEKIDRMLKQAGVETEALAELIEQTKAVIPLMSWFDAKAQVNITLPRHDDTIQRLRENIAKIRSEWNQLCNDANWERSPIFALFEKTDKRTEEIEQKIVNLLTDILTLRSHYMAVLTQVAINNNEMISQIIKCKKIVKNAPYPENYQDDACRLHKFVYESRSVRRKHAIADMLKQHETNQDRVRNQLLTATRSLSLTFDMQPHIDQFEQSTQTITGLLLSTVRELGINIKTLEKFERAVKAIEKSADDMYRYKTPIMLSRNTGTPSRVPNSALADWRAMPDYRGPINKPGMSEEEIMAYRQKFQPSKTSSTLGPADPNNEGASNASNNTSRISDAALLSSFGMCAFDDLSSSSSQGSNSRAGETTAAAAAASTTTVAKTSGDTDSTNDNFRKR